MKLGSSIQLMTFTQLYDQLFVSCSIYTFILQFTQKYKLYAIMYSLIHKGFALFSSQILSMYTTISYFIISLYMCPVCMMCLTRSLLCACALLYVHAHVDCSSGAEGGRWSLQGLQGKW